MLNSIFPVAGLQVHATTLRLCTMENTIISQKRDMDSCYNVLITRETITLTFVYRMIHRREIKHLFLFDVYDMVALPTFHLLNVHF